VDLLVTLPDFWGVRSKPGKDAGSVQAD
jgi:hypothetical protein